MEQVPNVATASKQYLFDHIAATLIRQGERSSEGSGHTVACFYRHKKGSKTLVCAVGALIKDSEYTPKIEQIGIDGLTIGTFNNGPMLSIGVFAALHEERNTREFDGSKREFLTSMQMIHDGQFKTVVMYVRAMRAFAESLENNLNTTRLQALAGEAGIEWDGPAMSSGN